MSRCVSSARRRAFTLVEVTLAIGVAAIGFLAVFGLLPVGINTNQAALEQTAASGILSAVCADLRSTAPGVAKSREFEIVIPTNPVPTNPVPTYNAYVTNDGKYEAYGSTVPADAHFLLTVTFLANGTGRVPTLARLKMSWPAAAGVGKSLGSVEQLLVLDRN